MEGVPGMNHVPNPNYYDKSIVLDVKPLRSLKPVFPNGNQGPPFVGCPPFGPPSSPSGPSPFYPFGSQQPPDLNQTQDTPPPTFVTPLQSYRSPTVVSTVLAAQVGLKKELVVLREMQYQLPQVVAQVGLKEELVVLRELVTPRKKTRLVWMLFR